VRVKTNERGKAAKENPVSNVPKAGFIVEEKTVNKPLRLSLEKFYGLTLRDGKCFDERHIDEMQSCICYLTSFFFILPSVPAVYGDLPDCESRRWLLRSGYVCF
jgi:hypothetical protein